MQNTLIITTFFKKKPPEKELRDNIKFLCNKYEIKSVELILDSTDPAKETPIIEIGPYKLKGNPSRQQLEIAVRAATDRQKQIDEIHQKRNGRATREKYSFGFWKKMGLWFNNHYLLTINLFVALFIGIAFLAPLFMKAGWETAAASIYNIYKLLCHQLAFRSFFIFGKQAIYPRLLAHINVSTTYEAIVGHAAIDIIEARNYVGDAVHGYKIALCQRDLAMYGSFLLFGLFFAGLKEKIRTIKLWMWLLIGVFPIAFDGGTQLLGLGLNVAWFPERESTPFLRILTGVLFGFFTAWYMFPLMAEAIHDKRKELIRSQQIHQLLKEQDEIDQD